jgi:hypothetical protein
MTKFEQMVREEHQHGAATRFLNRLLDSIEVDDATKQHIRIKGMHLLLELPYDFKAINDEMDAASKPRVRKIAP